MYDSLKTALIAGDIASVKKGVQELVDKGISAKDILEKGLVAGMDVVGQRFKCSEMFIPEVMIAAKAMHGGLDILQPLLAKGGVKPVAKVIIGTVKGDLHDIGKNIVSMMFKGAGFSVVDLGIDVPPERFIDHVRKENANILAMSSLLTTSMVFMGDVIKLLKKEGLASGIKTMVGGAPVTQEFADKIGADAYAEDAGTSVEKARALLGL